MIRINLLPVKAAKKRERAGRAILPVFVVLMAVPVCLFVFHGVKAGEADELKAQVRDYQEKIEKLKQEVGDFDMLRAQREQLMSQREVIRKLESGRVGPVNVLLEFSRLVSPGGQPTMDAKWYEELLRENPSKAYDPTWDPRRLVVTEFTSSEDGTTYLQGFAKDNSDLAEFVRRIELSQFFEHPYIDRSDTVWDSEVAKGVKHIRFSLHVEVRY